MRAGRSLGGTLVALLVTVTGCSDATGAESVSLILTLRNQSDEAVNLLLAGEQFGTANNVAPGGRRTPPPLASPKGSSRDFRAGRNGEVLHTVSCVVPSNASARHNATVDWDGSQLSCVSGWQ